MITDPNRMLTGEIEPWRCDACNKFIYNLDEAGKPTTGAPQPKFLDAVFKKVCTLCFEMGSVVRDSSHFNRLHNEFVARANKSKNTGLTQ